MIPAQAHFQRYRQRRGAHRRLNQRQRVIWIAHQGGAGKPACDLLCRAAHVDVDNVGASLLGQLGAFSHPMGLAAGKLDDKRRNRASARRTARHVRPRPA